MTMYISQFKCKNPHCYYSEAKMDERNFDFDDDGEAYCRECNSYAEYVGNREAEYIGIGVYSLDRAFGGHEEGGWWFDVGSLLKHTVRCFERADYPQMREWREMLERRYPSSRHTRYEVKTFAEKVPPNNTPDRTPRYS